MRRTTSFPLPPSARRLAAALLLSLLAACGGGGGGGGESSPPTDPVTPGTPGGSVTDLRSVSAVVPPTGGSIAADGLRLALPAGATTAPLALRLVTQSTPAEVLARFRFEPAGQRLRQAGTLSYSAPGLPAQARFFWNLAGERTLLASQRSGDTLTASITGLGYAADGSRIAATPTRMQRLSAGAAAVRPLADGAAGEAGVLEVQVLDCEFQIAQLERRLRRIDWRRDAELGQALYEELAELKDNCSVVQIAVVEQAACSAQEQAIDNASVLAADSFLAIKELIVPLLNTAGMVQMADANCPDAGGVPADLRSARVLSAKFDQMLSFVGAEVTRTGLANGTTMRDLRSLLQVHGLCERLGLEDSCQRFYTELYPPLLDDLRRLAFAECRRSGAQPVMQVLSLRGVLGSGGDRFGGFANFSDEALEADAVFCTGPSLNYRVFADAATLPDEITDRAGSLQALGSPARLGEYTRRAEIKLPPTGSLNVRADVRELRCADGSLRNDEMVWRIDGRELLRRAREGDHGGSGYGLATQGLDFVVERDLTRVGLTPGATNRRTLTLVREGSLCGEPEEGEGSNDFAASLTMFTLELDLTPEDSEEPPLPPSFPSSEWTGTLTLQYRFSVQWDETQTSSALFCGFFGSVVCTRTSQGSYDGQFDYTFAARSAGAIEVGATANLVIDAGEVAGSLTGLNNTTFTATSGACTRSGAGASHLAGSPLSARAVGAWRLRVQANGQLELGANQVDTVLSTEGHSTGTSTATANCLVPEGTTPSDTPPRPGPDLPVHLVLGGFRGLVDPGGSTWEGSETLHFDSTGASCENLIVDTPAQGRFADGITSAISCTATLEAHWSLRRR